MQVKRFVAADMRRALELVRHELGPDAVILSNKHGKKGVEVLASLEVPAAPEPEVPVHLAGSAVSQYDLPMASDQAWQQQGAHIAQQMAAAPLNSSPVPSSTLGVASGKTRAELAAEVDSARQRMLAAKQQGQVAARPSAQIKQAPEPALQTVQPALAQPVQPTVPSAPSAPACAPMPGAFEPELTAPYAPEQAPSQLPGIETQVDHRAIAQGQLRRPAHPAPVRPQSMDVDDKMKILMTELAGMRSLLEEQIAQTTAAQGGSNPVQEAVKTRLDKLGLSKSVSKSILNKINTQQSIGNCWNQAMSLLAQSLPVVAKDITDQGGVFAFVGPTGVGKTTTVGKLAARYVMKHGPEQVALITTDTYRIAAHDQLRALGAILKVPVKVVEEGESLKEIIDSFNNRSLVLIDTAGFRHGDPMLHQQLALVQQHRAVRSYLVMAANNQWQMLKASAHAYAGRGLSGAVLSKLDETTGLGEALSVIIEHDLPLAYSTNGQNIPQDIEVAHGQQLLASALELSQVSEPMNGQTAEA